MVLPAVHHRSLRKRRLGLPIGPRSTKIWSSVLVLAGCLMIGCTSRVVATPIDLGSNRFALPAANWERDGVTLLCAGVGFVGATINGSPDDPVVVWVDRGGTNLRLSWPSNGYVAQFTPLLEVIDPSGQVVFRAGDSVGNGCETADSGVWMITP
jgi:hypothetical protein